jgi:hypothetical protein
MFQARSGRWGVAFGNCGVEGQGFWAWTAETNQEVPCQMINCFWNGVVLLFGFAIAFTFI